MTNERSEDLLEEYLQSDAPARAAQFDAFLAGLKALASRGEAACASAWACRAISPALDYSAHLRLHKIISRMPPGPSSRARDFMKASSPDFAVEWAEKPRPGTRCVS